MFITLEGPEGSGKTSHIPILVEYLTNSGYRVTATREPGGTSIGDQIREVLLSNKNTEMHPRTEILLFQASRAQLVEQVILQTGNEIPNQQDQRLLILLTLRKRLWEQPHVPAVP